MLTEWFSYIWIDPQLCGTGKKWVNTLLLEMQWSCCCYGYHSTCDVIGAQTGWEQPWTWQGLRLRGQQNIGDGHKTSVPKRNHGVGTANCETQKEAWLTQDRGLWCDENK